MNLAENLAPHDSAPSRRAVLRYGIAFLSIGIAILLRWALAPVLGSDRPYLTLFGGVAFAVWFGRWGAAAVAAAAGFVAANYFFVQPRFELALSPQIVVETLGYGVSTGLIIFFGEAMHRAGDRADREAAARRRVHEAEQRQKTELAVTLASIGDGVIVTDAQGRVTFLNGEAERLMGWKHAEAGGQPLSAVFRIVNEGTRQPAENPVDKVLAQGKVVGMANHTLLIARDGTEIPIDDSAAPIRSPEGALLGVVLVFRDVGRQRQAELIRARLATIVDTSGDAILSKSLEGTILTWNASAERMFGFRAEEMVGKPVTRLIPSDLLLQETEILDRLRQGKPFETLETVRLTKEGRRIPVSLTVSPIKDQDGSVIGASKVVRDISGTLAAREALAREKNILATTLASIGDGVVVTDVQGRVTFLNAEAERLTGWKNGEAQGQELPAVFRIVNETTRQLVENPVEKVFRLGTVVGLANHTILLARDGTETPIDDSAAPIRSPGGPLFGVVLVFRDFTEPKKAQRALAEYARMVESGFDAIIVRDAEDRVIRWNRGATALYGWKTEEVLGQVTHDLLKTRFPRLLAEVLSELRRVGRWEGELIHTTKEGRQIHVLSRWSLERDEHGTPVSIVESNMEITDRKRAEEAARKATEELARANTALEATVEERTAKLREMIDELQHVSYSITHDMRAPLRAMTSFSQMLLESAKDLSPENQDYCRRIVTGAARLDRLIQDALGYSRAVLQDLPLEPVDLTTLIGGLLETYPNFHPDKADLRLEGKLPVVLGNEALLTQCFSNLLGNAVKFVAPGSRPRVRVWCDSNPELFKIWIEDNGIGIPKHAQSRLFGMFQKLDNRYEGTGIGLAIVRKVVERMGGQVGVESEPGKGSRFWVSLRRAVEAEAGS